MNRVAGVDGCPGGWCVVLVDPDGVLAPEAMVLPRFTDILALQPALIAVDMPIGLPDRAGPGGRGAEAAVRPLLGARQSSVFSVPSREAVAATDYGEACAAALATSDPPRKVSRQGFQLFPKIREIDALLVADVGLRSRVFEVHPEVGFWRLAGGKAMTLPKKVKSASNLAGLDERRVLLEAHGLPRTLLDSRPPKGAARDDLIDACVSALIGLRILRGEAQPFPPEVVTDRHGIRIAIWA
ncbi:DUF429 domain-containing protein [Methylobrevis pamukkalensis]|uniref:DUF429 domain-containing protein n=1 Tax=Methylobrevis pamukkalensis TaxID=1439726 RepID=A0A1E3HAM6_9HYPH|nr:DUF429 domain-containing protein [Methylobrevis pamukkalensis]ODN72521.1 hypothetical protein A6302_00012 [Methylobrevis pamukkalensis]